MKSDLVLCGLLKKIGKDMFLDSQEFMWLPSKHKSVFSYKLQCSSTYFLLVCFLWQLHMKPVRYIRYKISYMSAKFILEYLRELKILVKRVIYFSKRISKVVMLNALIEIQLLQTIQKNILILVSMKFFYSKSCKLNEIEYKGSSPTLTFYIKQI